MKNVHMFYRETLYHTSVLRIQNTFFFLSEGTAHNYHFTSSLRIPIRKFKRIRKC